MTRSLVVVMEPVVVRGCLVRWTGRAAPMPGRSSPPADPLVVSSSMAQFYGWLRPGGTMCGYCQPSVVFRVLLISLAGPDAGGERVSRSGELDRQDRRNGCP